MDKATIINLLTNSGINVSGIDDNFIYFQDPSCIFPVFDTILNYAWIVILILTAFMLGGWALLYIKNGVNVDNLFNNAKTLILIFCILSAVKPIVNVVYGDNLFSKSCDIHKVDISEINKLLDMRNENFRASDEVLLYESFDVIDSGVKYSEIDDTDIENNNENNTSSHNEQYVDNNQINTENINQTNIVSVTYNQQNLTVIYTAADGSKIKRSGGSAAWRNNNPGNIVDSSFARENGAIGSNGKFAIFPEEETGMRAIIKLLRSNKYNNLSIKDAIHKYAPAADNNNPARYTQKVANLTGLSPEKIIKNLDDNEIRNVANAIRKIEGWNPGQEQKYKG